jgi:hypothetical protein
MFRQDTGDPLRLSLEGEFSLTGFSFFLFRSCFFPGRSVASSAIARTILTLLPLGASPVVATPFLAPSLLASALVARAFLFPLFSFAWTLVAWTFVAAISLAPFSFARAFLTSFPFASSVAGGASVAPFLLRCLLCRDLFSSGCRLSFARGSFLVAPSFPVVATLGLRSLPTFSPLLPIATFLPIGSIPRSGSSASSVTSRLALLRPLLGFALLLSVGDLVSEHVDSSFGVGVIVIVVEKILEFVERVADIGEVEEGILVLADIDERGVHPLDDTLHASQVDRPDMALLVGYFEEDLGETLILVDGNAKLVRGCIDDYFFLHGWVRWPMSLSG